MDNITTLALTYAVFLLAAGSPGPATLAITATSATMGRKAGVLFALGVRLIHINWQDWKVGLVGAVVSPLSGLAIALPASYLLDLPPQQASLLILFGALPPAVLNYLVAERYRQQPQLVASIVLMGNLAALLVIPLVLAFIL
jgi:predicted permease